MEIMDRTRQQDPQLFELDEKSLRNYLADKRQRPSPTIGILRMKFWHEFDRAQGHSLAMMNLTNVFSGVCFIELFNRAIRNPYALAWILCPPASYISALEEGLIEGMNRARQVLDEDPYTVKGEFNVKLAELQFRMLQYFDQRRHGAIVQKIENTNKSMSVSATVNVPSDSKELAQMIASMSEAEMEKKLADMKSSVMPIVDVTPE